MFILWILIPYPNYKKLMSSFLLCCEIHSLSIAYISLAAGCFSGKWRSTYINFSCQHAWGLLGDGGKTMPNRTRMFIFAILNKQPAALSIFQKGASSLSVSVNLKDIWINKLHYERGHVHAEALVSPWLFHCCSCVYRLLLSLSFYMVFTCVLFSCLLLSLPLKKVCSFHCWHLMFWAGVTPSSGKNELLSCPQWPCFADLVQNKPSLVTAVVLRGGRKQLLLLLQGRTPGKGGLSVPVSHS